MKTIKNILLFTIISLCGLSALAQSAQGIKKENLKVLVVGNIKGSDQKASQKTLSFEKLLKDYFTTVTTIDANDYNYKESYNHDVTLFCSTPKPIIERYYDKDRGISLIHGYLPHDFDRPVVAIGATSEQIGRRLGSKNDWYCLCLDADAHNWKSEHPIFNGPFKVKMTVVEKSTPEGALHYPYFHNGPLPKKVKMWSVQKRGYKTDRSMEIGMVARPWGYLDSPDCEFISSGVSDKTLDAVAIGRHGNYLHWGFAASPDDMTEEAKPVFANAVAYMAKFAGKRPIARKYEDRIATREYIKEVKYLLTKEAYEAHKEWIAQFNQNFSKAKAEAEAKKSKGQTLTSDEERALGFTPQAVESAQEYFIKHAKRTGLYEEFGNDVAKYHSYYDQNYDYFFGEGFYNLEIDQDVKSLGIPNYNKKILDKAIELIESDTDAAKGKRILARYTLENFASLEFITWHGQIVKRKA